MLKRYIFTLLLLLLSFFLLIPNIFSDIDKQITVGSNFWIGYQPIYISKEAKKNFKLIEYPSASETLRAFENGVIDIAGLTLDEALSLTNKNIKFKIFLIADISNGADALISQANIQNLDDIKGKRIGLEDTALGGYILARILDITSISSEDITVVPIEANEHKSAFLEKKVDMLITFEPIKHQLVNLGANVLLSSSELKDEIVDIFVARDELCQNGSKELKKFKKIWFKSLENILNRDEETLQLLSKRLKIDIDDIKNSLNTIKYPNIKENNIALNDKLNNISSKLSEIMINNSLLDKKIELNKFICK